MHPPPLARLLPVLLTPYRLLVATCSSPRQYPNPCPLPPTLDPCASAPFLAKHYPDKNSSNDAKKTHSRQGGCWGLLQSSRPCKSGLLVPLLLLKRRLLLLLQLLLPHLLPLVACRGPLYHLHGIQVAVGGLTVHSSLHHSLGGVGRLVLLHLLLLPGTLLHSHHQAAATPGMTTARGMTTAQDMTAAQGMTTAQASSLLQLLMLNAAC